MYKLLLYVILLYTLSSSAVSQTNPYIIWPPTTISTTISPFDRWYFAGTNTYINAYNLGGTTGINGYFIWNGIRYDTPEDFGIVANSLTVIGRGSGDLSDTEYTGIKRIRFEHEVSGFYVDLGLSDEVIISLGSHWHTLYVDEGDPFGYTPDGQQPLNIKVNPDPTVTGTSMDTNTTPWTLYIPKTASGGVYTNSAPTVITVGGIGAGSVLNGKDQWEIFDGLFFPELWPALVNPSRAFTASITGFREVGSTNNITFVSTFNRGTISPAYGTSGFRSGHATNLYFTHNNIVPDFQLNNVSGPITSNTQIVNGHITQLGSQSWTGGIFAHGEGEQPVGSKGTPTNSPYSSGVLSGQTREIIGVYPFFATTVSITTLTKAPLQAHGTVIIVEFVEEDGANKQTIDVPYIWGDLSTVEQWNPFTQVYDSLEVSTFTKINSDRNINGNTVSYDEYRWNLGTIGARRVRFTF